MKARRSRLMVGTVRHRRHRPRDHEFTYGLFHALIDLDELGDLNANLRGFGHNRRAITTLHDTDHLGPAERPIRDKLRDLLAAHDVALPDGSIQLHTNLRVLGHTFNPVSWFFCHDADDDLALIVAEVNNTFGDTWCYVLDDLELMTSGAVRARRSKRLHVSPFLEIDGFSYTFVFHPPAATLAEGRRASVHMDVFDGVEDRPKLDVTQVEHERELTDRSLVRLLVRHPLMPLTTVFLIHLQAVFLFAKKVGFFRRPEPPRNHLPGTTGSTTAPNNRQTTPSAITPATTPSDEPVRTSA